jgi:tRNA-dihydrouridine synthase B
MGKPFKLKPDSLILAPLAGVSDYPFRLLSQKCGADLTYVEMISVKALIYQNKKTLELISRGEGEQSLGVQITGNEIDDFKKAVEILNGYDFDTIDINMGCPVRKVVKTGGGSAILQDTDKVYKVMSAVSREADIPTSAKIRLGWDRNSLNFLETADALERGGAEWVSVHGRTRSEDYSYPVDLGAIAEIKKLLSVPVIGNGNIFCHHDYVQMKNKTGVDHVMVSRGSLGNPWVFKQIKTNHNHVSVDEWFDLVMVHLELHRKQYENCLNIACLTMRKHLLWYLKGWKGSCEIKKSLLLVSDFDSVYQILNDYKNYLKSQSEDIFRSFQHLKSRNDAFYWDPKFDMDRKLDGDRTNIAY